MDNITFQVINNCKVLYQSDKRWLFPLFDFEAFLTQQPLDISRAEIHDKVVGKAAAILILRLGVGSVHADVVSQIACAVFDQARLPYSFGTLVDRIDCQTEEILLDINDPEVAYRILSERANCRT